MPDSLDPDFWDNNDYVYWCLADKPRTDAFRTSVRSVVSPGDVVLDLGAGTGVLGLTAVQAGASKVYLVELDTILCRALERSVALNSFGDRVEVVQEDALEFQLDEHADVVICEMIATAMVCEFQAQVTNHIQQFCKQATLHVPGRYRCIADLVSKPAPLDDLRLSVVSYDYWGTHPFEKTSAVLSAAHTYREFDFSTAVDLKVEESFLLTILIDGLLNGLRLHGTTFLHGVGDFDGSTAYSNPMILPIPEREVQAGDVFQVDLSYTAGGGFKGLSYEVKPL